MKEDRILAIRQHLFRGGFSTVQQISEAVDASFATIRRDLLVLESENVIVRSHGGARINESFEGELAVELREQQNLTAKRAIGEAAFSMITPNSAVFLDAGTTVLQVARCIRLNPMPLSIFTNSLTAAQVLMDVREIKITLLAGTLRNENASIVGHFASEMLDQLWFDHLFLGAGAIAEDCRIYSLNEEEARLNEKMLSRTARKTVLVDSSKFGRHLTYLVVPLSGDIKVITDAGIDADFGHLIEQAGCELQVVSSIQNPCEEDRL